MTKTRIFLLTVVSAGLVGLLLVLYGVAGPFENRLQHPAPGKGVTAAQAYAMWQADPDHVKIIDVRTTAEYALVGHPPMAYNIPFSFWTPRFDSARGAYTMRQNPEFIKAMEANFSKTDPILLLCRSGHRSGVAEKILRNAGFSKVHNITDGFEGSRSNDRNGSSNGWKNSGAPWTYELDPERAYSP